MPARWPIGMMAWRIGEILDIEQQLDWVRDAGFNGVGFHASAGEPSRWQGIDPAATDPAARARLRDTIAGFAFREIHAPFALTLSEDALRVTTSALLGIIEFAGDLAASIVTIHARLPASRAGEVRERWEQAFAHLNASAVENGVMIGLEVTDGFELIEHTGLPNLGITLDIGHVYLDGAVALAPFRTIGGLVRRLADLLVHLHVHDYDGTRDHIEPGAGCIDFDDLLTALDEVGYEGGLCLELNPDHVSPDEMRRSAEWLLARVRELCSL